MNIKFLYRKLTKIKKTLPGNKYEKGAMIDIIKYQFFSFLIGVIFLILSFYFNEKLIYALVFLYPIIPTGTYAIPIVLQEPGQPGRFNALSYIFFSYIFLVSISFLLVLFTMWINYKITLLYFILSYFISIYNSINIIKKKSADFYN